jgi:GT2 family glycosyltransferase
MFLSVVVCTHRRPEWLAELLASIGPQVAGNPDREIVVVNDGTDSPQYREVLAPYGGIVRYEALAEPHGIARTRNATVELARGEYVVFTDDDCVAPAHWLDWLEARLRACPELDVVAGTTRPPPEPAPGLVGRAQSVYDLLPRPYSLDNGEHLFVTACLAVRADLLRAVGGFRTDGIFAVAGEDSELASRLCASGARIHIDFDWHVFHKLGTDLRAEMRRYARYGYANTMMAARRLGPRSYGWLHQKSGRQRLQYFTGHLRRNLARTRHDDGSRSGKLAVAFVAAAIQYAYDAGCIRANRERARSP